MLNDSSSFSKQFRTVLVFLLLLGIFNGLYQLEKKLSGRFIDRPYTFLATEVVAWAGNWLLPFPVVQRNHIVLKGEQTAVVVRGGCNGLEAIFLMLAGILAFPASWRQRWTAFLLYLPLLFVLNLLRILMLLFVMVRYPAHIDLFHYQIGQGIMVVFVMTFWWHYVRKISA